MPEPFLLIDDADTNTAENGLTSDSISTGGVLAPPVLAVPDVIITTSQSDTFATELSRSINGATITTSSASTFSTEFTRSFRGATITTSTAQTTATETSRTFGGSITQSSATPTAVSETSRAIPAITDPSPQATTFANEVSTAIAVGAYTDADADPTIVYIPPFPRMGFDVTSTNAQIQHGRNQEYQ